MYAVFYREPERGSWHLHQEASARHLHTHDRHTPVHRNRNKDFFKKGFPRCGIKSFKIPHNLACLSSLMSTLLHASYSHHNDLPVRLKTCQLHSLSTCYFLYGGLPADHLDLLSVCHYKLLRPFSIMKLSQAPSTLHRFHPPYFIFAKYSPLRDATVLCSFSVSNFPHSDSPHQPVCSLR